LAHELTEHAIRAALKEGHVYVAHDWLCDSTGFAFVAQTGGSRISVMGDEIKLAGSMMLSAATPVKCTIKLIRNGELLQTANTNRLDFEAKTPGVSHQAKSRWTASSARGLLEPDLCSLTRDTSTLMAIRPTLRRSSLRMHITLFIGAAPLPVQTKTNTHEDPDWEDQIVPGSPLTVFDLTRRLIPDTKRDSDKADKIIGSDLSRIRTLDGVEATGMELDLNSNDECEITEPDYFWLKNGSDRLLVLLLTLDAEKLVIGLFKTSPTVALVDVVTIAQDVHVNIDRKKLWSIHPQHEAFAAHGCMTIRRKASISIHSRSSMANCGRCRPRRFKDSLTIHRRSSGSARPQRRPSFGSCGLRAPSTLIC
jgi:hypothetical protein